MSEIQTVTESTQASTPEQVEQDIQALEWRDFQLLGIAVLILLVIAAGFLALLMPQLIRKAEAQLANRQEFTSLFFGLIGLLVLLNIYMFDQRLRLQRARRELIHQLQRAERMARIDPLTGIPNRRSLKESLEAEISRSQRTNLPLTVMVSDVDNFKSFNTRFGHLTGDRVLMDVASLLRKNFRAGDFIVRYGGDEFVVVMPDTDMDRARAAVERLNRLIDSWNSSHQHCGYTLGLTCGLTEYVEGATVDQLIQAADLDMYFRKSGNSPSTLHRTAATGPIEGKAEAS
ncbi:MAG: GGDEF domain-containing protein [Terriglobales bacterium]